MIWIGSKNIQTNVVILAVIVGIQLKSGAVVAETDPQQHIKSTCRSDCLWLIHSF